MWCENSEWKDFRFAKRKSSFCLTSWSKVVMLFYRYRGAAVRSAVCACVFFFGGGVERILQFPCATNNTATKAKMTNNWHVLRVECAKTLAGPWKRSSWEKALRCNLSSTVVYRKAQNALWANQWLVLTYEKHALCRSDNFAASSTCVIKILLKTLALNTRSSKEWTMSRGQDFATVFGHDFAFQGSRVQGNYQWTWTSKIQRFLLWICVCFCLSALTFRCPLLIYLHANGETQNVPQESSLSSKVCDWF